MVENFDKVTSNDASDGASSSIGYFVQMELERKKVD